MHEHSPTNTHRHIHTVLQVTSQGTISCSEDPSRHTLINHWDRTTTLTVSMLMCTLTCMSIRFSQSCCLAIKACLCRNKIEKCFESEPKTCPWTHITCADSAWRCLKRWPSQQRLCPPPRAQPFFSDRVAGMRGWEALKGEPSDGWKPPPRQGPKDPRVMRRWQVWSGWVQKHEGEEEEDNEGVCGPGCSCRRWGGAGLTDKMARWTERWRKEGRTQGEQTTEMGLQTADCPPGVERRVLVCPQGGRMAQTSRHQSLTQTLTTYFCSNPPCSTYICAHIDVNRPLRVDLYLWDSNPLPSPLLCATVHSSH